WRRGWTRSRRRCGVPSPTSRCRPISTRPPTASMRPRSRPAGWRRSCRRRCCAGVSCAPGCGCTPAPRTAARSSASGASTAVRWQLEGWLSGRNGQRPSAPLTFLELAAEEVSPAAAVSDGLWGRHGRGQAQAGRAALRVQGLIGADAVLAPVLQGGRSPRDRVRLVAWGDEPVALRDPRAPWPGQIPSPLPATVPATPVPARVLDDDGTPVVVADRGVLHGMPARVEVHRRRYEVTGWAGPWPVHERWWAGGRPRTYVQVVCGEIALLLAGEGDSWWVEGVYD